MYILRFSTQYSIFILDFVDIDFQSQEKIIFRSCFHFSPAFCDPLTWNKEMSSP